MGEKYHLNLYVVSTYALIFTFLFFFLMGNLVSWILENLMRTLVKKQMDNLVYKQMVNRAGSPGANHTVS